MVLNKMDPKPANGFRAEFEKLDEKSRERVRSLVCTLCGISRDTFRRRLDTPEFYSKVERYMIAQDIFGMEVKTLFNSEL